MSNVRRLKSQMSAFNYIEAKYKCPACKTEVRLHAQCHVAASFEGNAQGRFSGKTYQLGESMAWWPAEDPRHKTWREGSDPAHQPLVGEACYAECLGCHAELCAIVELKDLKVVRVASVSLASEWPVGYVR